MENLKQLDDAIGLWLDAEDVRDKAQAQVEACGLRVNELVNARIAFVKDQRAQGSQAQGTDAAPSTLMAAGEAVADVDPFASHYARMDAMNLAAKLSPEGGTAAQLIKDAKAIMAFASGKEEA